MLRLTDLLHRHVLAPGDRHAGDVRDVAVCFDQPDSAFVTRFLVERRGAVVWVPATIVDLTSLAGGTVRLIVDPPDDATDDGQLRPDELLLGRDVLDTQIVDIRGKRVSRVGDVVLAPTDGGVRAVAVEVGFGSVLRRLGLGRFADHGREQAVAWGDLHLTSNRGHVVECHTEAALVHRLDAEQLAELVARLPSAHAVEILATVPSSKAERTLAISHPHVRSRLMRISASDEPAPPRWHRLRGWERHRGPRGAP